MKQNRAYTIALMAVLLTLLTVLAFTPLGYIPLGPFSLTTLHIPVIVAALIAGPTIGAMAGFMFGCLSMLHAFLRPHPTSILFLNPFIALGPRVLIGIITASVYRRTQRSILPAVIAGTLTNTLSILLLAGLFYQGLFGDTLFSVISVLIFTFFVNGIPELIAALVIVFPVVRILQKFAQGEHYDFSC